MNCLIVDTEIMARKYLQRMCARMTGLKVVSACGSLDRALDMVQNSKIDLLFVDADTINNFHPEVIKELNRVSNIIVTFSRDGIDIKAFNTKVTHFIKKPISFPKFKIIVDDLIERLSASKYIDKQSEEVFIRDNNRFIKVRYQDIFFIENVGDYAKIVTAHGTFMTYGTIKAIAARLPEKYFLRVHRSYIVNWKKIVDIEASSLVVEGRVIPVSRKQKVKLMNRLNIL